MVLAVSAALSTSYLAACENTGGPSATTPAQIPATAPAPVPAQPFNCDSDLKITTLQKPNGKGMCIDDESLFGCSEKLLQNWPHTEEPIQYVRLFKAFRPEDSEEDTTRARENFVQYVKANNIKVLVGSQITCSEEDDEKDWGYVQKMINALGKEHVLALAVGNELDQPNYLHDLDDAQRKQCSERIWGGYLFKKTVDRIDWARKTIDNAKLQVTTVVTGSVVWTHTDEWTGKGPAHFQEDETVKFLSYLTQVFQSGEKHFVFVMNFYPIFDPGLLPDGCANDATNPPTFEPTKSGCDVTRCDSAMAQANCYNNEWSCKTNVNAIEARKLMKNFFTSNAAPGIKEEEAAAWPLWIGELGWSAPKPKMFGGPLAQCDDFFSNNMLYSNYKNFLEWDLNLHSSDPVHPPEIVFYFTMRDAKNFGQQEHFGLVESCTSTSCKLSQDNSKPLIRTTTQDSLVV